MMRNFFEGEMKNNEEEVQMETIKSYEEYEMEINVLKQEKEIAEMELAEALETIKYMKVEQQTLEGKVSEYRKNFYEEQSEKFKYRSAFKALVEELTNK